MLHFDGVDGAISFPDSSPAPTKSTTAVGTAQIDTAQSVFGGASLLLDGDSDYISTPDSADWNFSTGDFTIDGRIRFSSIATGGAIISQYVDASNFWRIDWEPNRVEFQVRSGAADIIYANPSWTPSADTWYHLALVRTGNDFKVFIDGTQIGSTVTDTDAFPDYAAILQIGALNGGSFFPGWIDELRISKGIARWTTNFTPPTAAYTATDIGKISGVAVASIGKVSGVAIGSIGKVATIA